jgi:hypothetical protein
MGWFEFIKYVISAVVGDFWFMFIGIVIYALMTNRSMSEAEAFEEKEKNPNKKNPLECVFNKNVFFPLLFAEIMKVTLGWYK